MMRATQLIIGEGSARYTEEKMRGLITGGGLMSSRRGGISRHGGERLLFRRRWRGVRGARRSAYATIHLLISAGWMRSRLRGARRRHYDAQDEM